MPVKINRPEYDAWRRARKRCNDPKDKHWKDYGGRGIKMAEEWETNFKTFLADLGPKPTPLHSLDRIETDGNYAPGNCRWATPQEQAANRRFCHLVEMNGQVVTIQEAGRKAGIPPMTLRNRLLKQGLLLERAMTLGRLPFRKDSKHLTHAGVTRSVPEWAKILGIRVRTLRERLRRKMPLDQALQPGLKRLPLQRS